MRIEASSRLSSHKSMAQKDRPTGMEAIAMAVTRGAPDDEGTRTQLGDSKQAASPVFIDIKHRGIQG